MKRLTLLAASLLAVATSPAWALPYLKIESAPIWADNPSGANQVTGAFTTSYMESFPTPTRTLAITNTGPVPDGTPSNPGLPYGYDYFIKTQVGDFSIPGSTQMVVNLEGVSIAGQGGMIDIMSNMLAADQAGVPAGKVWYSGFIKVGVYDVPMPSAPNVLSNSRVQRHILENDHDPATENLSGGWSNITDIDGLLPSLTTTYDASGLDVVFGINGGLYPYLALEDSALRVVTIYQGVDPGGQSGSTQIPEPATFALLGASLIGLGWSRRRARETESKASREAATA